MVHNTDNLELNVMLGNSSVNAVLHVYWTLLLCLTYVS